MKRAGRNILGLSALSIAAPFAVHIETTRVSVVRLSLL